MEKDETLVKLFQARMPHFDDGEEFMQKLTKRLDAVEIVRQYQERMLRRYRVAAVACFLAGIIGGGISVWWLFSLPAGEPLVHIPMQAGWLLWLAERSRFLACAGLSSLTVLGVSCIAINILDIMELRRSMKEGRPLALMSES